MLMQEGMAADVRQMTFFEDNADEKVVNVASVPQRSPFRYPGGKTWLIPHIRRWLTGRNPRPSILMEPFAGGGIVSLTVAAEHLADHVVMVELDADVAAVWQTILDPEGNEWLAETIVNFDMSYDAVRELLAEAPATVHDRAFHTIVKNRVYHGGILAPGSGLLKHGENGRGVLSRWYPATLARRIRDITRYAHRITFLAGDALEAIPGYLQDPATVFFIDPPYTVRGNGKRAGKRLYTHSELDHDNLFTLINQAQGDFLMTYDDAAEVRGLAQAHHFDVRLVAMKNTHHATMKELLIGRDLSWV